MFNLKYLDISHNKVTSLPEGLGALARLEHLTAHHNKIDQLLEDMDEWTRLVTLDLSFNHIVKLSDSISAFTSLTDLNVSYNHLDTISQSIKHISQLTSLKLQRNRLKFSFCVFIRSSDMLYKFRKLPNSFKDMGRLVFLNLYQNQLEVFFCFFLTEFYFNLFCSFIIRPFLFPLVRNNYLIYFSPIYLCFFLFGRWICKNRRNEFIIQPTQVPPLQSFSNHGISKSCGLIS